MFCSYTGSVQEDKDNNSPIEPLLLNGVADPKAESFFCSPKPAESPLIPNFGL
jgi:hypothetical protein